MNTDMREFANLFETDGSEKGSFAKCWLTDEKNEKGKRKANYLFVHSPPGDADWDSHAKGEFGLTLHPEKADGTCSWCAIDFDFYDEFDFKGTIKLLEGKAAVGRSKSVGAHAYFFLKDAVPAEQCRDVLGRVVKALGYTEDKSKSDKPKAEVFPKKVHPGKEPVGINIPYSGWLNGDCPQTVFKLIVPPSGSGAEILEPLKLPNFVKKYVGRRITFAELEALAAALEKEPFYVDTEKDTHKASKSSLSPKETGERWLKYWENQIEHAPGGEADNVLNKAVYRMGHSANHIERETVERRLRAAWAKRKDGIDLKDFDKVWPRVFDAGIQSKEQQLPWLEEHIDAVFIGDISTRATRWLWPGKLARGKISMLSGWPKLGKSIVAADTASRLSSGAEIPFSGGKRFPKGKVLYFCAEDDHYDTLVPRFRLMGADPNGIKLVRSVVGGKHKRRVDLTRDIEMLRQELTLEQYSLVVFDPISAYEGAAAGEGKANTNPAVRGFVAPIEDLGHDFDVCMLFVNHQRKDHSGPAIYSIVHSIAWAAVPRVILVGGKHFQEVIDDDGNKRKEETGLRLIGIAGSNNAPDNSTLTMAYRIVGKTVTMDDGKEDDVGVVEWVSEMDIPADHVTAGRGGLGAEIEGGTKRKASNEAEAFIRRMLKAGPMRRDELSDRADEHEIAKITLTRAGTKMAKNHELYMVKQPGVVNGPSWWSLTEEIQWEMALNPPI